jgi:hypothetical protein
MSPSAPEKSGILIANNPRPGREKSPLALRAMAMPIMAIQLCCGLAQG